jgi:hypothetical protein
MCRRLLKWLGLADKGLLVPPERAAAKALIHRMRKEALPFIAARTLVLYGATETGDRPYILATGVPLKCGDHRLILTASHVLDEIRKHQAAVYIRPGTTGGPLVPLDPLGFHRSALPLSGSRIHDQYDLAVINIPSAIADDNALGITYAEFTNIDPYDDAPNGSYFFFHGFPSENLRVNKRKRTVHCESLPYGTFVYDGSRGEYPQHEDVHLDLDFHPRMAANEVGRRVRLPDPRGISGCGIWRLMKAGTSSSAWTVDQIRLVAIEHRYNSDLHVLRGTRIKYVNRIVFERFPDVRHLMTAAWG